MFLARYRGCDVDIEFISDLNKYSATATVPATHNGEGYYSGYVDTLEEAVSEASGFLTLGFDFPYEEETNRDDT